MEFQNNTKYNDKKYAQPGIYNCVIQEVYDWSKNPETKYIVAKMKLTKDNDVVTHKEMFLMTEKKKDPTRKSAKDVSMEKLKHLILVCAGGSALDNIKSTADINSVLKDKEINIKFVGKEFLTKSNKIGMWVNLPIFKFAEKLGTNPSKLTFDPNKDIIRLKFDERTPDGAVLNLSNESKNNKTEDDDSNLPF